jgi:hypothetical protein
LEILKEELDYACQRHAGYKNYVRHCLSLVPVRSKEP